MNKRAFNGCLVWMLAGVVLAIAGCGKTPDTSGRNKVIKDALDQQYGFLQIPTGKLRITGEVQAFLRRAESAGLVTLREIPQGYWDSFLSSSQGMGTPFEVIATPKLLGIVIAPTKPEDSTNGAPVYLVVKIQEAKVDKVVAEEDYKGHLATPGEKHRLILGLYRAIPTSAARTMGDLALGSGNETTFRFRCVVRYSEFKKEWSVVAIDAGFVNPESWITSNVK